MRKTLLFLTLLMGLNGFGQQEAVYSQYLFNQMVINPAYAGSRNSMSAVLLHRTRWMGMEGAPATSTFSLSSDLNKSNVAWGVNMAADRLGATTNVTAALAAAYHLRLKTGKLSFGLRAGIYNSSINWSKLDFRDQTDDLNVGSRQSNTVPTLDFGLYYYTRKFYVGLGLNHMNGAQFNYPDIVGENFYLRPYNTFGMGYAWEINDKFTLKPSFLLKQTNGFASNLDLNLSALFYKRIWFGVSFRNQTSMNFLLEVNITDYMRAGYSYDAFINKLNTASGGAHELFVGFDFTTKKTKTVSTRYL